MTYQPIYYQGKKLRVHKAIIKPDFDSYQTIIVTNPFEYVEMWLKRKKSLESLDSDRKQALDEALFYWHQAQHFFNASKQLPKVSSPLTSYYCFLNATKCLLTSNNKDFNDKYHGVKGDNKQEEEEKSLDREQVTFKKEGILSSLCQYLSESANDETYSLQKLFYNLPYIHRAYNLTFKDDSELFVPISDTFFVKEKQNQIRFYAEIKDKYYTKFLERLPNCFERVHCCSERLLIRKTEAFQDDEQCNCRKIKYNCTLRKHLYYIYGSTWLWYIKLKPENDEQKTKVIDRSSMTLTFAAMHRLSELARYSPMSLKQHFESEHNWLLSTFISTALDQFIDEISSEITGQECMMPK